MSHVHCEDGAFNEDVPSQSLGAILRSKAKSQKNSSTDMNYSSSPSRSEDDLSESRSDQGGYEEVSELNRTLSDNEEDSHHDGPGEQYDTTQADPSAMLDEKGDIHAIGECRGLTVDQLTADQIQELPDFDTTPVLQHPSILVKITTLLLHHRVPMPVRKPFRVTRICST